MTSEPDPATRHTPSLVPQTPWVRAVTLVLVALAYYAGARLGLGLSLVESNVTPLWPPTGVAVAAMLVLGRGVWPAVAVAALAVNLPISETLLAAAVTAVGNTVAPYLAVVLLHRAGFRRQLARQRDALAIIFVGALLAMLVSASIGAVTLVLAGTIPLGELPTAWTVWWTGDAMGVLVVAPFLLSLPLSWELEPWTARRWLEAGAFLAATTALAGWTAQSRLPLLFLVLPIVGWAAWRLQLRGAAPAALSASLVATWAAVRDRGPFTGLSVLEQMATLQAFNVCVALTSFVFAALVSERRREARELLVAAAELEERVKQRTLQLSTANARLVQEIRERSYAQEQLTAEEARSHREHEIAETLQRSLVPDRIAEMPGVDVAARYVPATADVQVGGDWYDVIPLPDGLVGLAIGDVAGHGLQAAATMVQVRMALRAYALQDPAPASVMCGVHRLVSQLRVPEMVTLLYLVHDPSTGSLRFSNAGHPPALVVHGGEATYLTGGLAPPLGVTSEAVFTEASHELVPGATLLLYTDGLVERRGVPITDGLAQLADEAVESVETTPSLGLEALCDHLLAAMLDAQQVADDVALVALRPTVTADGALSLRLPAEARMLVQVRGAVRRWLRESGIAHDDTAEILVACGEACANVVQHAYSGSTDPGPLEVEARVTHGRLEMQVRDHGRWRAPADRGGGWGLQLMQGLMDDVDVEHTPAGTIVHLRRDVAIETQP
jgi:serine phosphatase RsbU (regulator of sigma subunit)/integral membrane sensor domain MASE1/anti-sigma regulatory factor (Ser/Thr protein kinase)